MSKVYFCATEFYINGGYRSYTDFFELVRLAGYPIISVKDIDPDSDNTYIFTPANGETVNGWPNAKAQIILWQLEWMLTDEHNTPPGVRRVWASDKWFALSNKFEYVPIGSDIRLNPLPFVPYGMYPKHSDVSLLSYQTGRRQLITQELSALHLILEPVQNLWGIERSQSLVNSRAMVHVHQHDNIPTIAPLRWALAAAHCLPIITENVYHAGIFHDCMIQTSYHLLSSYVKGVVRDKDLMGEMAAKLFSKLCVENTFRKVVEAHL